MTQNIEKSTCCSTKPLQLEVTIHMTEEKQSHKSFLAMYSGGYSETGMLDTPISAIVTRMIGQ